MKPYFHVLLVVTAMTLAGCAGVPAAPQKATLYERLGGAPVMTQVVSRMLDRVSTDPLTRRSFDGVNMVTAKKSLGSQFCQISGGACIYEGETMVNVHRDLKIGPSEFDALVAILRQELDRAGVDAGAKNELLKLLAPMKRDIVTTPHP